MGVRPVSFAVHWIKAEIHEYVLRNWRIVKVATTKAQRKLFFNLRKTKQRLGWFNRDEVEMVARELGVTSKDVREMESRMAAQDMTFDLSPTTIPTASRWLRCSICRINHLTLPTVLKMITGRAGGKPPDRCDARSGRA